MASDSRPYLQAMSFRTATNTSAFKCGLTVYFKHMVRVSLHHCMHVCSLLTIIKMQLFKQINIRPDNADLNGKRELKNTGLELDTLTEVIANSTHFFWTQPFLLC